MHLQVHLGTTLTSQHVFPPQRLHAPTQKAPADPLEGGTDSAFKTTSSGHTKEQTLL